jgi:nitrogen regulatory protein PII
VKEILAIIRPEKLGPVRDALVAFEVKGITSWSVQGFGRQLGYTEVYRGVKIEARLLPKVMLSLVVPATSAEGVISAIRSAAFTGEVGDGKIIVLAVDDAVRIRTGESGEAALL